MRNKKMPSSRGNKTINTHMGKLSKKGERKALQFTENHAVETAECVCAAKVNDGGGAMCCVAATTQPLETLLALRVSKR